MWRSRGGGHERHERRSRTDAPRDRLAYRNTRFYCERELAAVSECNEAAIDERWKRIENFAMVRWKI